MLENEGIFGALISIKHLNMSYTNASHLGHGQQEWLGALEFYETDLGILEKRLAEVNDKNTASVSRAEVEHYQNQFIIQRNNIIELRQRINKHQHEVVHEVQQHVGRVAEQTVEEQHLLEADMKNLEKIINELRHDFNRFLAKWL
jgi:hypothetical protein